MLVVIPVENPENPVVASMFARAGYVAIADTGTGNIEVSPNPASQMAQGAGTAMVQSVIQQGAGAVIVPNIGPNALGVLQSAGIPVYQAQPGTPVENALSMLQAGELPLINSPTSQGSHPGGGFGPGGGAGPVGGYRPGQGWGRGMGRGMGRGRGRGRGGGFGRGGWGGRGGFGGGGWGF